jgi:hypothetical protein
LSFVIIGERIVLLNQCPRISGCGIYAAVSCAGVLQNNFFINGSMSHFGNGSVVNHRLVGVIEFSGVAAFTAYHAASLRGFARSRAVLRGERINFFWVLLLSF